MMLVLAWGQRQGWTRLARWAGGVVGALGSLVALLFVAMQGFTDHSDTWWNADFVWASLGFWAVAGGLDWPCKDLARGWFCVHGPRWHG